MLLKVVYRTYLHKYITDHKYVMYYYYNTEKYMHL